MAALAGQIVRKLGERLVERGLATVQGRAHEGAMRLGHKDPSITHNIDAGIIPQDDGEAADVYGWLVHRTNA
ncbi:hypothetical protein Xcel_2145 [Xylanimonas cellulosilytica DSM 15894]|uniref:Uncharacterized protein n=1 Tax=Xylanimonas cellulosilytica (strain DSM 15894 / JCM 12276 / CECT 5975 / KCTC 9989 / LMG 20990 / NBRC 107835 / XIL07) TaxID=446471 RepID=D1BUF0_XYLCX|nr:hypothetical protein Xcel_2145 [Xylanimonas cellulosilytica DSM 15894]